MGLHADSRLCIRAGQRGGPNPGATHEVATAHRFSACFVAIHAPQISTSDGPSVNRFRAGFVLTGSPAFLCLGCSVGTGDAF